MQAEGTCEDSTTRLRRNPAFKRGLRIPPRRVERGDRRSINLAHSSETAPENLQTCPLWGNETCEGRAEADGDGGDDDGDDDGRRRRGEEEGRALSLRNKDPTTQDG